MGVELEGKARGRVALDNRNLEDGEQLVKASSEDSRSVGEGGRVVR